MSDPFTGVLAALGSSQAGVNAAEGLYGIFSNERDFWSTQDSYRMAREREDNAVQRRAADLRAAGLNPLLAVGSPASSMAPIRAGGTYTGKTDISGPILKAAEVDYQKRLAEAGIENARSQNALIVAQAEKTAAEKTETEARTELLREQASGTAAQTVLTNRNVTVADETIKNKMAEFLQLQSATRKITVETAYKELEKRILERDSKIVQELGIMQSPPSGATGQTAQFLSYMYDKLGKALNALNPFNRKFPADPVYDYKKQGTKTYGRSR